jgi:hypothetical protein
MAKSYGFNAGTSLAAFVVTGAVAMPRGSTAPGWALKPDEVWLSEPLPGGLPLRAAQAQRVAGRPRHLVRLLHPRVRIRLLPPTLFFVVLRQRPPLTTNTPDASAQLSFSFLFTRSPSFATMRDLICGQT